MKLDSRFVRITVFVVLFGTATQLALYFKGVSLWRGFAPAIAANTLSSFPAQKKPSSYDLTQLRVVNEVLKIVRDRYIDPKRVRPREMLLSALNYIQREIAQVMIQHEGDEPRVKVILEAAEQEFRVDDVQGIWDVSARLKQIFSFLQKGLQGTEIDLQEVEYVACNGMLHTLDPHTVLLSPMAYKEMTLSTSGQFGGLGIGVGIRDQQLTVISPMPGTPAFRAGIKKYDRILQINQESTLNMGLTEAVNYLRGAPGTKVMVWIHRDGPQGWAGAKPFELVREVIHVISEEHKLLEGNIGLIRIKQFQASTASDLDAALTQMRKQGALKGLILDLRYNPGGLLDQAIKVADKFIREGPLVATVGNPSEGREEKYAHPEGDEPNYPMVVLVNGASASASEIVAGALKNHHRALVVGETTFGKGTVQMVFTDLPEKAALKMTIAQYLTEPGDISIQGVGITPDVELVPMVVDPLEMDLTGNISGIKERDLSRSLSSMRISEGQKPSEVVRYYFSSKEQQELRDRAGDFEEGGVIDFPIRFARDLIAHVPPTSGKRLEQLNAVKPFVQEARLKEIEKVKVELAKYGINWSDVPSGKGAGSPSDAYVVQESAPSAEVVVETDRKENEVVAGEPIMLRVTVANKGSSPFYRLLAVTKSDNPFLDKKELIFGKIEPDKKQTAMVFLGVCSAEGIKPSFSKGTPPKGSSKACKIPSSTLSRSDGITIHFSEARGWAPPDVDTRVTIHALERPSFAYNYQIVDNRKGNGDGLVQKGEAFTLYLTVRNVGKGRSYETQANLRNLSGDGLLLREGRFDISSMQPGEVRQVAFTFDIQPQLQENEARLELSIADRDLHEVVTEKIRMIIREGILIRSEQSLVQAKQMEAVLLQSPLRDARVIGKLLPDVQVPAVGVTAGGDYYKVVFAKGRFGFVCASEVEKRAQGGVSPPSFVAFEESITRAPPALEVSIPTFATRESTISIKGVAEDKAQLLDAYIFVGFRKVFYRSNKAGADPKRMEFEATLPLQPGPNVVTVVARETPDTIAKRVFVIRRDGTQGEILHSPKGDEEWSENSLVGE
ncbi:MXAN_5808 family serine peptidase [Pajaroellobacter abortibovis]|uniref:Peptidase S41 n=1 Tax=Pajaroellobacter abortibovis TaxID=1882918 RepID=A0A1L6MVK4_9BACT|nr:MXAN_5808 family serine peptidase [Pajaroellobacter abortibovis]APR99504.1 peptidase S41 [Pajaroellobacter abortibovis]